MSDSLAEIREIIAEHQSVRSNVKLVGESVSDQEALNSLRSTRSDWTPGQFELLAEKRRKLAQTVSLLDEGLKTHFAREEKVLPSFLGDFLMQALLLEHGEIKKAIGEARLAAGGGGGPEGASQAELEKLDAEMQRVVGSLSRLIETHADKEDMMLEMVQRTLDEEQPPAP
jgi:hypothetical protein